MPCGEETGGLAPTSVHATRRVIVGVTVEPAPPPLAETAAGAGHAFLYSVQINNARDGAVAVLSHEWLTVGQAGAPPTVAESGDGPGGKRSSGRSEPSALLPCHPATLLTALLPCCRRRPDGSLLLPAGEAVSVQGLLRSPTPVANAFGHYVVRPIGEGGGGAYAGEPFEAAIGVVGLTATGGHVPDLRSQAAEAAAEES